MIVKSIKSKIILSSVTLIGLTVGILAWLTYRHLDQTSSEYLTSSQKASDAQLRELDEIFSGSIQRMQGYFLESLESRARSNLTKDQVFMSAMFADNEISTITEYVANTHNFSTDVPEAVFFVGSEQGYRLWVAANEGHPDGFGLGARYDGIGKRWGTRGGGDGSSIQLLFPYPHLTAKLSDGLYVGRERSSSGEEYYLAMIEIPSMDPEESSGYLAYVYSLVGLEEKIAKEKTIATELHDRRVDQRRTAHERMVTRTQQSHEDIATRAFYFTALLLLIAIVFAYIQSDRISSPVKQLTDLSQHIARGDYTQAIEVRSHDEIGFLGKVLEEMRVQVRKYTEELQEMVDLRTEQLAAKTRDLQRILATIQQGILTFGEDFRVRGEHSDYLRTIVERKNVAGADVFDLIFGPSSLGSDARSQVREVVKCSVGNNSLAFEVNEHILPREVTFANGSIYELSWAPMIDEEDNVEKLLLVIRDVTEYRRLQATIQEQQQQMVLVGQLLKVGIDKYRGFAARLRTLVDSFEIADNAKKPDFVDAAIFELHTLKGVARIHRFDQLVDKIHDTESVFIVWRNANKIELDQLASLNDDIRRILGQYELVAENIRAAIANTDELSGSNPVSFGDIAGSIVASVPEIAQGARRPEPSVVLEGTDEEIPGYLKKTIEMVLLHLVQNSIAHGTQRDGDSCTVHLTCSTTDDQIVVRAWDDGLGLGIAKLKRAGVERGLISPDATEEEVAQLVFVSGISTARKVSKLAGRGVGMASVADAVKEKNGKIDIYLDSSVQKTEEGRVQIRFDLTFPKLLSS